MRTEEDETGTMSLACAHEVGRVVDDGEEVWIIGGLSGTARGLGEVFASWTSCDQGTSQSSPLTSGSRTAEMEKNGLGSVHWHGGEGGLERYRREGGDISFIL
jgi:hypothetical protein